MASKDVEASISMSPVQIDACASCRLFWFDRFESTSLAPRATLNLFQYIGSAAREPITPLASRFSCPRCQTALESTKDLQRTTPFTYWRCDFGHGKLISFNQFLREKNFIRAPSPAELVRLRETVKQISCSQCGAPVDLATASACAHCGAPIALIDPDSVAKALQQLTMAAGGSGGLAGGAGTDVSRTALYDAQIDALFEIEHARLHGEPEVRIDTLEVGARAIGALIGAFLTLS